MTFTGSSLRRFGLPSGYEGTSMAAPHVAATAALIIASGVLGRHPTPAQITARLRATARKLGGGGDERAVRRRARERGRGHRARRAGRGRVEQRRGRRAVSSSRDPPIRRQHGAARGATSRSSGAGSSGWRWRAS